ncbi:MAG TPA: hypothetical protein VMU69_03165 [Bradyrhizobium sp.]|nr:hypothetical protein [Bradyrhizobium sp.]
MNAHPADSEHDHRRSDPAGDRAAEHEAVKLADQRRDDKCSLASSINLATPRAKSKWRSSATQPPQRLVLTISKYVAGASNDHQTRNRRRISSISDSSSIPTFRMIWTKVSW